MTMMNYYTMWRPILVFLCLTLFTYELLSALLTFYKAELVTVTTLVAQEKHPRPWICLSSKYLMRQSQVNEVRKKTDQVYH